MKISMQMCKQVCPVIRSITPSMAFNTDFFNITRPCRRDKVVLVMGATGTGKSKLSIDLATLFPAEIINSDKIQIYRGLDIVTNKVTEDEQRGIPHHLLSIAEPDSEFDAKSFCRTASHAVQSIIMRQKLPIIVGGSNSYIEALVDDDRYGFRVKYDCCFLWMDVAMPVLEGFLSKRVDKMLEMGMVEELRGFFDPNRGYTSGIRAAIGAPEFDKYLRGENVIVDRDHRHMLFEEAVDKVKENTRRLAYRQSEKIYGLRDQKRWGIHRLDATKVFLENGEVQEKTWKKLVVRPSVRLVRRFLDDFRPYLPPTVRTYELGGVNAIATTH